MTVTATRTTVEYISATGTAKLVRAALKAAFPGQKFSVRTDKYSMGASIRVTYNNAALPSKDVEKVARKFEGAKFDGMTDMASYHTSVLDGKEVHYCADYVFVVNEADHNW